MNSNFHDNLKPTRSGFTLVELLFVIAIIGVLAAMATGVLGKAKKDSQIAATRSRITQIEAIMQTVMEDYEVRRLPFRNSELSFAGNRTQQKNLRRQIVAAMLQAEFPSVFNPPQQGSALGNAPAVDVVNFTFNFREWAGEAYGAGFVSFLDDIQTAEMAYWEGLANLPANAEGNFLLDPDPNETGLLNQPGEYLYLILQRINIDGISALETLGPNVVGDPDDDGVLDIVDAFGDSMELRLVQVDIDVDRSGVTFPLTPLTMPDQLPANTTWVDKAPGEINWKQFEVMRLSNGVDDTLGTDDDLGIKIPRGYRLLNPLIPRSINKIRFQVLSQTLDAIE